MITTFLAATLILSGQTQGGAVGGQQQPAVSPKELISKMLAKYANAKTIRGRIVLTTTAMNQSGTLTTDMQLEKPDKLYIHQQKNVGDGRSWLTVSDGKLFSYDAPELPGYDTNKRLLEKMVYKDKKLDFKDVYAVGGANLGDRSTALDILISRNEDLRFDTQQWQTMTYEGTKDYNGTQVHIILGKWRPDTNTPATGQFRLYITDAGDLKQFARVEKVRVGAQDADVVMTWDVNAEIDVKVDHSFFKVK